MTLHQDQPTTTPLQRAANPGPKAWFRRGPLLAGAALAAGLAVGLGVGVTVGSVDPVTTPQYVAVASDRDVAEAAVAGLEEELATVAGDLDATRSDLEDAKTEVVEVVGDLPDREAALEAAQGKLDRAQAKLDGAQAKLDEAEAELDARSAALTKAEKAVAARERKVGIVETTVASNTMDGEGIYEVGRDMKAGTYRSSGNDDCYYAVLDSPDTSDVLTNNITSGPAIVSVAAGQYFHTTRCGEWVWQS